MTSDEVIKSDGILPRLPPKKELCLMKIYVARTRDQER